MQQQANKSNPDAGEESGTFQGWRLPGRGLGCPAFRLGARLRTAKFTVAASFGGYVTLVDFIDFHPFVFALFTRFHECCYYMFDGLQT